ncbi:hypothetical protein [Desulfocurvibacter africanus]|uniref:hypothetical protein n=1 Tax=Desulfocurvibacter africanus TaxID=873 RepID=UPI000429E25D|nr:hypothetical protein [Desulfocurvibacter africanus]
MSDEITLQSLGLKKTLDKMTAKELRQLVMDKIPQITGATGMDKDQLLVAIKDVLGIKEEEGVKNNPYKAQIHDIKSDIRSMREQKAKATARKDKDILRKRINKLKKRTRRLSRAV